MIVTILNSATAHPVHVFFALAAWLVLAFEAGDQR